MKPTSCFLFLLWFTGVKVGEVRGADEPAVRAMLAAAVGWDPMGALESVAGI